MKLDPILKQAQHNILDQMLGLGPGFGSNPLNLRFLLGREMYFHALQGTGNPAKRQPGKRAAARKSDHRLLFFPAHGDYLDGGIADLGEKPVDD